MLFDTAGRTPAEGLSYPYPMETDQFPGKNTPADSNDQTFYAYPGHPEIPTKTFIYEASPLNSIVYQCVVNNPQETGDFDDTLTAELNDENGDVTARITCGVTGQIFIETDGDGAVTYAEARATCDDVLYEKISPSPIVNCNSQRIVRNDHAQLLFADFIRLYPDGVSGSGVNYPACIGRIQVIR